MREAKRSATATPGVWTAQDGQTVTLEAAGLDGVCTDQHLNVLKAFGNTTAFLKNENFIHELTALLPDEVALILKAAAHQAIILQQRVTLNELNFGNTPVKKQPSVNIVISPYFDGPNSAQQLLILFTSGKRKTKDKSQTTLLDIQLLTKQHLSSLEEELSDTKNKLEAAYGLINSSNENIRSFNEELQSANEEMRSGNEELQSVNEELQTVNRQQQQTNSELTESNDDLNNYFRSNTNGQLFVDHNLLLKRYSPGAVKHINLRESDIGRPLTHITTNIKFETLVDDVRMVMSNAQTIIREAESNEGKIYQVMTMPYIRQSTNDTDGAVISFYDISELKALLEKEKQLNVMKSRFVSMASHEFKTPLTAIQLSADLINRVNRKKEQPGIKKYTETINNAVKNLTNILNDFLCMDLLENSSVSQVMAEFDLVEFTTGIAEDMQALCKPKQQISCHHSGIARLVTLNPFLLKNCIINLISNAIKYSGPGSLIKFYTRITGIHLVIMISDNGIGIPENDQKHLFEVYFRAKNTGNIPGTGLGLNIVTRYLGLMNGDIRFKSRVNRGSTFTFTLPVKAVKND